ncbi:MAG: mechanosensitive ion channel [Ignavibacteria bacterium]|nr:mechanosensitive ion channel [Ignavibacteria bacterium]
MDILQQTLFKIGGQSITLLSIVMFVFVFLLVIIFSRVLRKILIKRIFPRHEINEGVARSIARIANYFILALGLLVALNAAGINVSLLFAGGAALMVGIGFGLQNVANNFISGIIILFERPIKEGDFIEVGGKMGTVVSISARSTKIKTNTGIMIIVPNSYFIEKEVINRSYIDKTQIEIPVTISHDEDFEKVKQILLNLGNENELVLKEFPPSVSFSEITDIGILVKLWVWIKDQDMHAAIRSQINYRILQEFGKAGIKFPVQQRIITNKAN